MSARPCFVSAFRPVRPAFEATHEWGVSWLASAHAEAERRARAESEAAGTGFSEPFDPVAFATRMEKLIARFGCTPGKIARRGTCLEDFLHLEWDRMRVFGPAGGASGADVGARGAVARETALEVFRYLYAETSEAPADLVHVSCTGYVSPSAAQEIVVEKGWHQSTQVTHAYHMGCYAAIPALRMARGFTYARGDDGDDRDRGGGHADVVHTELCTLHFDPLKHSPEQLVVQSLFADGYIRYRVCGDRAEAARLCATEQGAPGAFFGVLGLREEIVPASRHAMTWQIGPTGFAMTLAREVPALIAGPLEGFLARLFAGAGLSYDAERARAVFAVHPGGPRIIETVRELLGLAAWQVRWSEEVLHDHGNMSSATLPHIWDAVARDEAVDPGTLVVSLAFGPGLTICGALLRKDA